MIILAKNLNKGRRFCRFTFGAKRRFGLVSFPTLSTIYKGLRKYRLFRHNLQATNVLVSFFLFSRATSLVSSADYHAADQLRWGKHLTPSLPWFLQVEKRAAFLFLYESAAHFATTQVSAGSTSRWEGVAGDATLRRYR